MTTAPDNTEGQIYRHGLFMWYELLVPAPDAAAQFYEQLVGWTTHSYYPKGVTQPYITWMDRRGPFGALLFLDGDAERKGLSPHWFSNVFVRDLDVCLAQVQRLGGKVLRDVAPMGTVGWWTRIADPAGAEVAVFAAKDPLEARDTTLPNNFAYNELHTEDPSASFAFYQALFDWQRMEPSGDDGAAIVYGAYNQPLGAMIPGAPAGNQWVYSIRVAELDRLVSLAVAQGAQILHYGDMHRAQGRIVRLKGPQGAVVALHELASPPA